MLIDATKPVVLVVDDSPDSLGMINTALDQAGYTVLVALNGQQALDIVDRIKPDVVLMDAVMPVMDGFEACRILRKTLPLTPVIFMTGLTDVEHIVKAFEHGGNDYITKPILPEELLARISAHVKRAEMINNAHIALDQARQFVLAIDAVGDILWVTPETGELLAGYGIDHRRRDNPLNQALGRWLADTDNDLVLRSKDKPLIIRYFKAINSHQHLLRVIGENQLMDADALEAHLPLTKREAEVLLWVAHGKTNQEIGEILSMSPRTVNKHLQQIYPKIHVDNRAGATAVAIQALLGVPGL